MRFVAFLAAVMGVCGQELYEGIGTGYEGELRHVTRQLLQLAEAIPEAKYGWRPAEGVMSVGDVYAHVAVGNYFLLDQVGVAPPKDLPAAALAKGASKAEVVKWLRASLEALKTERAKTTEASRARSVRFLKRVDTTADGVWLRILVHLNEHMGQSIAYARMNGVTPPWSEKK